jgi:hypothetical protein
MARENSKIKLKIMRKGKDKPVEVTITRARIQVRSVRSCLEGYRAHDLDQFWTIARHELTSTRRSRLPRGCCFGAPWTGPWGGALECRTSIVSTVTDAAKRVSCL